ncbi:MAG: aminotransferase class III-fold pyridoxal phosphate-dependent enzyme [Gammaproteobacteria bacterium]
MIETSAPPAFELGAAAELARRLYRLHGEVAQLPGERDLNYLVSASSGRYVFKIAHFDEQAGMLECRREAMARVARAAVFARAPAWLESVNGRAVEGVTAADGRRHHACAFEYIGGRLMSQVNPHTEELLESWGERVALLDGALRGFSHAALARPLLWAIERGCELVAECAPLLESDARRELTGYFAALFREEALPVAAQLRRGVIHNDANDNNVLVGGDGAWSQRVTQIIDFGDMRESWVAADAAIAAAYAMLGKARPLDAAEAVVRGYHRAYPLREAEIGALFALMCMRLCMSVCNCAYQRARAPHNDYLRISEDAAWNALQLLRDISPRFARYALRAACGLEANPSSAAVVEWLQAQPSFAPVVEADLAHDALLILDTSVSGPVVGSPGAPSDPASAARMLFRALEDYACAAAIGRYDEHRLIYTHNAFDDITGHRRTLHLGIDIFMPAGARVFAPLDGVVYAAGNRDAPFDYGGVLIIEHRAEDRRGRPLAFHTLYGHLSPSSLAHWSPGDAVAAGQLLARLGAPEENGGWPPHLHFEIITDMLGQRDTFVGVGTQQHRAVWLSLCPDPNLMLGIPKEKLQPAPARSDAGQLLASRRRALGPSLRLSYREPLHLARGALQYLFDMHGRQYLDAVNNVAHVGHCHPQVVAALRMQAGVLNTNTRYLYDALAAYTERLLGKFPKELCVCYPLCSGSEANDLALRMARCHTGRRDVVALRHAYHGNLSSTIEVSSYKHDGAGGGGRPAHVHIAAMPDGYRGAHNGAAHDGAHYARDVRRALEDAAPAGGAAAFIAESALGCGGQVVLPRGYLRAAYAHARAAGAVCIADEVQVGMGRLGECFWGFETQGVTPDIVTIGKPLGNGHPMAAVVTTREIAASFDNGMEYFNSFGGNPVSCAVGHAVLDVIDAEQLQDNARSAGAALQNAVRALQTKFALLGDVRGLGLFIGVELVDAHDTLAPAAAQAAYIAERMKQEGVLIGVDGPLRNVLKIKPPMCFSADNAEMLVRVLENILREDFAQPGAG